MTLSEEIRAEVERSIKDRRYPYIFDHRYKFVSYWEWRYMTQEHKRLYMLLIADVLESE